MKQLHTAFCVSHFPSFWALFAHLLYGAGVIPCTFALAVFVCTLSFFQTMALPIKYSLLDDIAYHWAPLAAFVLTGHTRVVFWSNALIMAMYFAWMHLDLRWCLRLGMQRPADMQRARCP